MSFESRGAEGLNYDRCRYGASRLSFRGPKASLEQPYVALVGGTEIFGRFCERTIGDALSAATGRTCVNLGTPNAGIDAVLQDAAALNVCREATLTIVQVMGAQNMSNRMYAVHPRRNDRFLKASGFLETLYRAVDFTRFHYTRHLLAALREESADRYALVLEELSMSWGARMRTFIEIVGKPVCLLWLADREPGPAGHDDPFGHEPLFVSEPVLAGVREMAQSFVSVVGTRDEIAAGRDRMVLGPSDLPVAEGLLGPVVHERAARLLEPVVEQVFAAREADPG